MAVQLILKNSAVQDKEATAAQLAAGELALNYHSSGPFLQCEDTAGNVWRLGGVVIASTAPSSPSKGAWWLDSDDNSLSFYDGSSWISIQTGETAPSDITEGTARQLLQTNAAGNGTEWTSDIDVPGTLDVTGVATFDNNVVITGNLTVNGTTTTIDTTTLVVEDKNIEMGAVDTPTDSTADGGGITLKGATDKTINWVNATDAWTSSERFDFPAGTEGAPSIILNGDVNSGIYQPGADQVAISTGGTGRVQFGTSEVAFNENGADYDFRVGSDANTSAFFVDASTGRICIGASNPARTLDVRSTADIPAVFQSSGTNSSLVSFRDSNTTAATSVLAGCVGDEFRLDTGDSERLRITSTGQLSHIGGGTSGSPAVGFNGSAPSNSLVIDSSGRLGVGTSSPGVKLTISDTGTTPGLNTFNGGNSAAITSFAARAGLELISYQSVSGSPYTKTSALIANSDGTVPSEMQFWTKTSGQSSPAERMRIDSSGRLGVGTTSPSRLLTLNGGANSVIKYETTGSNKYCETYYDGSSYYIDARNDAANGQIVFRGLGGGTTQEYGRFDTSGRLGIGTSSPAKLLEVSSSTDATIRINDPATIGSVDRYIGGIEYYTNDASGGAKVACSIKGYHVDISGNGRLQFATGAETTAMTIDGSGRVGIGTTAAVGTFVVSDGGNNGLEFFPDQPSGNSTINSYNRDTPGAFTDLRINAATHKWDISSTEAARIDSSRRLLIGTSSASGSSNARAIIAGNTNSAAGVIQVASTSSSPGSGDALAVVRFSDSGHTQAASINCERDGGTWTSGSSQPTRLVFSTTADGASSQTERMRIRADGLVRIGNYSIIGTTNIMQVADSIGVTTANQTAFRTTDGEACFYVGSMTTGRSINARGTVNASGSDYAEYMIKDGNFIIAKGDICGVTANGKLTNTFVDAISFVVKTTNPSIVGGDNWVDEDLLGKQPSKDDAAVYEEWNEKYEKARETVDRIAFAGQVPVNVTGATPGQYIVPVEDNGGISGIAKDKSDLTLDEYMQSVGKVVAIEDDGRARIIVKVA